jgi:hypothetical protein
VAVGCVARSFHTTQVKYTRKGACEYDPTNMKIPVIFVTAFIAVLCSACEEGERNHHHHDHEGVTSTTTTEETTVHQAAPASTTTVRNY